MNKIKSIEANWKSLGKYSDDELYEFLDDYGEQADSYVVSAILAELSARESTPQTSGASSSSQ